jgi:alpha-galactosidase
LKQLPEKGGMPVKLKIAYIGGGSKEWAMIFMNDLALSEGLEGEVALYDIDKDAALRNQSIGSMISEHQDALSHFRYSVSDDIESALEGADFVAISILPGLIETMNVDVHYPEKYGIYQSVGDTVGPGGVIRSMRTVPLFIGFAEKIKEICPKAWVINFTNPLSICVKTLYSVFPDIKAFGCCHEVFHAQDFLCRMWESKHEEKINRKDLYTDVSGVNHFTWISEAAYRNDDLLALLPEFIKENEASGFNHNGSNAAYLSDPFSCSNLVKMDLFEHYGVLGAAGDRHLAEFMPGKQYLASPEVVNRWRFALTDVKYRIWRREDKIKHLDDLVSGKKPLCLQKSDEEAIDLVLALKGRKPFISNVNLPNQGQMPGVPIGAIVETNAYFYNDHVTPLLAKRLPDDVLELVNLHIENLELLFEGIRNRDLDACFRAFARQPLCASLPHNKALNLFREMLEATSEYLEPYFDLKYYLQR